MAVTVGHKLIYKVDFLALQEVCVIFLTSLVCFSQIKSEKADFLNGESF